ncbi:hypothetical protein KKG45_07895 [bacterium]|nr:hypothetical protein [bacterium]MBU1677141.1 hypothetical protein [bacterium]
MEESEYRFCFNDAVNMPDVEETLLMAVIAAEGIHGRARVWLDAQFDATPEDRTCTVSADNEVGQSIARIFTEMLTLEFGEAAFQVGRYTSLRRSQTAAKSDRGLK